jgi:hypothetical protein
MFRRLRPRSIYDLMAAIGCFAALATGTAYAANTIGSDDIIDGSIGSADVKDNSLNTFDVHSFLGADVVDGSLTGTDIADNSVGVNDIGSQQVGSDEVLNDSLLTSDIRSQAVASDEVADNSLTGTDINESTLNLPQVPTTTTFASGSATRIDDTLTQIASRSLSAGSYSLTATVHGRVDTYFSGDHTVTLYCEARNGSGFIGAATDRSVLIDAGEIDRTIPIVAGLQVPSGGGSVSVWCSSQAAELVDAQMMITRIDGFF